MKNEWLSSMDSDGVYPDIFSLEPFVFPNFGSHLFSQLHSFLDSSFYQSGSLYVPGSLALQDAFNRVSRLAGALLFWFCGGSSSNLAQDIAGSLYGPQFRSAKASMQIKSISSVTHNLAGFGFSLRSKTKRKSPAPVALGKISRFTMGLLSSEAKRLQSYPVLSLAAALVPPFQKLSSKVVAGPLENTDVQMLGDINQIAREAERQGCACLSFPDLNWTEHAVEPKTGIEFPLILDNILAGEQNSSLNTEVLVGTGFRTMTIVKIKSLKIYAFGFCVHPYTLSEKLGPKYAAISADKLNDHHDLYQDLLSVDFAGSVGFLTTSRRISI